MLLIFDKNSPQFAHAVTFRFSKLIEVCYTAELFCLFIFKINLRYKTDTNIINYLTATSVSKIKITWFIFCANGLTVRLWINTVFLCAIYSNHWNIAGNLECCLNE